MTHGPVSTVERQPGGPPASASVAARLPGLARLLSPAELAVAGAATHDVSSSSRPVDPAAMLERVLPYLADYGITRIAELTHLDRLGLPVHTAYKPMGRSLSSGSGKGLTATQSKLGAAIEAIEQTYWEQASPPTVRGSQDDLERMGLVVADGADLVKHKGTIWHHGLPVDWTPMHDLATGEEVWVPVDLVTVPRRGEAKAMAGSFAFMPGTNGLAGGYHVADALESAVTEVLERDAVAIAKLAGTDRVDAAGLVTRVGGDVAPYVAYLRSRGLELGLIDATTEAGLPTYIAVLWDLEDRRAGTFGGYGTGFDEHRALVRAITEAVQSRGLITAGARDDILATERRAAMRRTSTEAPQEPSRNPAAVHPARAPGDSITALEELVAAAARCGCDRVLVMRHSAPGDPAQVVRAVIPGLEGYLFAGYGPGRRVRAAIVARHHAAAEARP